MEFKGILKERKKEVRIILAIVSLFMFYRTIIMRQWIFALLVVLLFLACFFKKEYIISEKGVDIKYMLFSMVRYNRWEWSEITTMHSDYKKAAPNVMIHIGRDIMTRSFIFKPSECDGIMSLASKMNPNIYVENLTAEQQAKRENDIMNRKKASKNQKRNTKKK